MERTDPSSSPLELGDRLVRRELLLLRLESDRRRRAVVRRLAQSGATRLIVSTR